MTHSHTTSRRGCLSNLMGSSSAHSLVLPLLQILTDVPHYHRDAVSQQLRPEVVEKLLDIFKVLDLGSLVSQTTCTSRARHCMPDPRPVLHPCPLPPVPRSTLPARSRTWQQASVARPPPNRLLLPRQPSALLAASCTPETCLAAESGTRAQPGRPPCLQQLDDLEEQEGLGHMYQIMKGAIMLADTSESGLRGVVNAALQHDKCPDLGPPEWGAGDPVWPDTSDSASCFVFWLLPGWL